MHELLHRGLCGVGTKSGPLPDPVGAFAGDGALGELVAKLDFEFGPIKTAFPSRLGNEELPTFLPEAVGHLCRHKCWSREDELQAVDLRKLGLQQPAEELRRLGGFFFLAALMRACSALLRLLVVPSAPSHSQQPG
jgi:hypothetical protein